MTQKGIKRRSFLGAGFLGLGALAGWFGSKKWLGPKASEPPKAKGVASAKPAVDLSEFQQIDHASLLYEYDHSFSTQLLQTKRFSKGENGSVWVCGDKRVLQFDKTGKLMWSKDLQDTPHAVVSYDQNVIIAYKDALEALNMEGAQLWRKGPLEGKTYFTALAAYEGNLYAADAGQRNIVVCQLSDQKLSRFGDKDEAKGNPGFVVPSGYFDMKITDQGLFHIANPGRLRVETWSFDGMFQGSWGQAGMALGRFCGCCNPVFFDVFPNGSFVTSEKGLSRVCIFNPDGSLKGMAMSSDELVQDPVKMKQARNQNAAGVGFDVLVQEDGSLLICDPVMNEIRTFVPKRNA